MCSTDVEMVYDFPGTPVVEKNIENDRNITEERELEEGEIDEKINVVCLVLFMCGGGCI